MDTIVTWIDNNEALFAWVVTASLFTFVGSLIAVPIIVVQMSADYFVRTSKPKAPTTPLRLVRRLVKNAVGIVFIVLGLAMLFLPGQGVLTILIGLSLVDFPGKRFLQLRLVRVKSVRRSVNWLRHKADRPPLVIPDREEAKAMQR